MPGQGALPAGAGAGAAARLALLPGALTMARGTIATRSFWQMKISARAGSEEPCLGYSTCQLMGWVPDRLLKLVISKSSCTTSWNRLVLLGTAQQGHRQWGARGNASCTCRCHTSGRFFPITTASESINFNYSKLFQALTLEGWNPGCCNALIPFHVLCDFVARSDL